jgi:hypothetical protein
MTAARHVSDRAQWARGTAAPVTTSWRYRTALCLAVTAVAAMFIGVGSRDSASGDVGDPTSTTVPPGAFPPAESPVIASGTLGAGATWSVVSEAEAIRGLRVSAPRCETTAGRVTIGRCGARFPERGLAGRVRLKPSDDSERGQP